jgi:hypothetical protein
MHTQRELFLRLPWPRLLPVFKAELAAHLSRKAHSSSSFGSTQAPSQFQPTQAGFSASSADAVDDFPTDAVEPSVAVLYAVPLEDRQQLERLGALLSRLNSSLGSPPTFLVLAGDFISAAAVPAIPPSTCILPPAAHSRLFSRLAAIMAPLTRLRQETTVVIMPGPKWDPVLTGPFMLPRGTFSQEAVAPLAALFPTGKCVVSGAVCRLRVYSKEVVIFRDDLAERLAALAPIFPGPPEAPRYVPTIEDLAICLHGQAHLLPIPPSVAPMPWARDYVLRLLPFPDVLVLLDSSVHRTKRTHIAGGGGSVDTVAISISTMAVPEPFSQRPAVTLVRPLRPPLSLLLAAGAGADEVAASQTHLTQVVSCLELPPGAIPTEEYSLPEGVVVDLQQCATTVPDVKMHKAMMMPSRAAAATAASVASSSQRAPKRRQTTKRAAAASQTAIALADTDAEGGTAAAVGATPADVRDKSVPGPVPKAKKPVRQLPKGQTSLLSHVQPRTEQIVLPRMRGAEDETLFDMEQLASPQVRNGSPRALAEDEGEEDNGGNFNFAVARPAKTSSRRIMPAEIFSDTESDIDSMADFIVPTSLSPDVPAAASSRSRLETPFGSQFLTQSTAVEDASDEASATAPLPDEQEEEQEADMSVPDFDRAAGRSIEASDTDSDGLVTETVDNDSESVTESGSASVDSACARGSVSPTALFSAQSRLPARGGDSESESETRSDGDGAEETLRSVEMSETESLQSDDEMAGFLVADDEDM